MYLRMYVDMYLLDMHAALIEWYYKYKKMKNGRAIIKSYRYFASAVV